MAKSFGTDISKYQTNDSGNPTRFFDPAVAKEKGIEFAFIKATGGILKDSAVDTFARTFTEARLPHGFYHYAYPTTTYTRQVDMFWDVIKDFHQDFPPVLDLEQSGVYLPFIQSFLGRLGDKCGKTPILYTRASYWNSLAGSDKASWVLKYPLWIANYKYTSNTYGVPEEIENGTKTPAMPNIWVSTGTPYTFWQYSQSGNGEFYGGNYDPRYVEKVALDMNCFNGTKETMYARFGIGSYVPPTPPTDKYVTVICSALKFRSKAELYPGLCLLVGYGTKMKFVEKVTTDIEWYKVIFDGYTGYVSANPNYTVLG